MKAILYVCLLAAITATASADERDECERLAPKYHAETEVRLDDGTRVDLLSERYAIEVDWSHKWAEGIGQALFYGLATGREPGESRA